MFLTFTITALIMSIVSMPRWEFVYLFGGCTVFWTVMVFAAKAFR
jgi:hypothetical protein